MGWLAKFSDAIICVSKAQEQSLVDNSPSLRSKTHLIYNPLPNINYIPIRGDDFAYFGGPSYFKGYNILLAALSSFEVNGIQVHAAGFPVNKLNLSAAEKKLPLKKYPWVSGNRLDDLYARSRAVVVPSVCSEPLPYVVYEALLRGRLIVASRIGGIPEQVNGYSGCHLFSPGNFDELRDLLKYVLTIDREEMTKIGMDNRERLLGKNQNEKSVEKFIKVANSTF
jgi:glycosyltransferase involved in cell wall biosynthesis